MILVERALSLLRGGERRDAAAAVTRDPYSARFAALRQEGAAGVADPSGLPTAYACIQLIAESMASLPLTLYRRQNGEAALEHPLHGVLHDRANETQTALEFREQLVANALATGNGYARKITNAAGQVTALIPLHARRVTVERLANGRLRYTHQPDTGGTETLLQDEVLHLRYRSPDGVLGVSPIEAARPTLLLAMEQQRFASTFLRRSGKPTGAFVLPEGGTLGDSAFDRLKTSVQDSFAGENRTPLLEQGLQFQQISLSQRDSQFIEQVKMTALDICRIFRVPPPSVGILDDATYSNITEQSAMLVKHCLRPWMVRVEQCMAASLLTRRGRGIYAIEHNAEGLLRGSQKERFEAYRIAREWGWLSVNEIRRIESMTGIGAAGDEYRVPMNSEIAGGANDDEGAAGAGDVGSEAA